MIQWKNNLKPKAPFVASIFNYYLSEDLEGYKAYDELTLNLVQEIPGYLGYKSIKHEGRGMFISYWKNYESIQQWAMHPVHIEAKKLGAEKWYRYYHGMIAEVNRYHDHMIEI